MIEDFNLDDYEGEDSDDLLEQLKKESATHEEDLKEIKESEQKERNEKKRRLPKSIFAVDKVLEKEVFGDKEALIENLRKTAAESSDEEGEPKKSRQEEVKKAAWHDSDDEEYQVSDVLKENKRTGSLAAFKDKSYKEHLESKFHRLQAPPKWADLNRKREVDSDDELLQTAGHLAKTSTGSLPASSIQFKRLKDLNRATYAEGGITNVQFLPMSTVALVTGFSGVASIYSIDGQKNDKLHSVHFRNFPIKCARILPSGTESIIGSSKNYFYTYDMMEGIETRIFLPKVITKLHNFETSPCGKYLAVCGRFGDVHLMDVNSHELLHTFRQEATCTALQFSQDSKKLFAHSQGSEVNIFDIRQQKTEHIFNDDGCISGKTLAISPNSRMIATGSNEGVVNVYDYPTVFQSKNPKPQKIIYNLTTSISSTKFNHSSEVLGLCSESVKEGVKLVHFPTGTVFANFPGQRPNLGNVRVIEFSPGSGYMAIGNSSKEVSLFRLKYFSNY